MGTEIFIHHNHLYVYMYTIYQVYVLWQPYVLINLQKVSTYIILYFTMSVLWDLVSISGLSFTYGGTKRMTVEYRSQETPNRYEHHNKITIYISLTA